MKRSLRPLLAALTLLVTAPALAQDAPTEASLPPQQATDASEFSEPLGPIELAPIVTPDTFDEKAVLTGAASETFDEKVILTGAASECVTSCDDTCLPVCGAGCTDTCCCPPRYAHRSGVFGEFLYMRARNAEVVYGTRVDGPAVAPPTPPIQLPPMGIVDPDYSPGFRAGVNLCLDDCSSISLSYTYLDITTEDTITAEPNTFIQPMLLHPSSTNAATNALEATGGLDIDFQFADADYRFLLHGGHNYFLNVLVGARYGNLTQEFDVLYELGGTQESVRSKLNFDGGGIRLGLDGERDVWRGFKVYGRGVTNFLAGHLGGSYEQSSNFDPLIADVRWGAGRLISILEMEVGAGWQSKCQRWNVTAGYNVNAWLNMVPIDEFIRSSQQNDFVDLTDTNHSVTFDGLVFRLEYRH